METGHGNEPVLADGNFPAFAHLEKVLDVTVSYLLDGASIAAVIFSS